MPSYEEIYLSTDVPFNSTSWPDILTMSIAVNDTNSTDADGNKFILPVWRQMIWTFLFVGMITVATGGNLIVIWIVLAHKRMRTVTNYFLVNLSIADAMVSTLNVTFNYCYMLNSHWTFEDLEKHKNFDLGSADHKSVLSSIGESPGATATVKGVAANSQKDEVVVNSSNEFKDNQIHYNAIEIKSSQTNGTDPHGVSSSTSSFSETIKPKRRYEHTTIPVHNDEIAMFKHPGNLKSASSQRNPGQPDGSADGDSHMVMIVVRPTMASSIRYNDPEASNTEENWMPIVVKVGNVSRSNERSRARINESVHEKSPVVETLEDIEPQMKKSSRLQSIIHDFILYGPKILKFHSKDIEIKRCHIEVMSQREQRFICKTTGESKFKLEKVKFSSRTLNSGKSSMHTTENTSLFPTSVRTEPVTSVNVHRQLIRENSTDVFDKPNNVLKVRPSPRPTSTTIEYSRDEDNAMVENQYSSDSDTNNETMLNNISNSQPTPGIIINP
ncbi:hypothetical protein PV326_008490, partial [Microctonus aethiopoides]